MFSDGLGTLIGCAVLIGRDMLNMSNSQLAIVILEVYVIGTFGTFLFLKMEKLFNISSKRMLSMHLLCLGLLPIYPLIGLIPGATFGLTSITEIWIWAFLVSIHFGSVQCFMRSVFAQLIPIGQEAEFFALYEVTDKG